MEPRSTGEQAYHTTRDAQLGLGVARVSRSAMLQGCGPRCCSLHRTCLPSSCRCAERSMQLDAQRQKLETSWMQCTALHSTAQAHAGLIGSPVVLWRCREQLQRACATPHCTKPPREVADQGAPLAMAPRCLSVAPHAVRERAASAAGQISYLKPDSGAGVWLPAPARRTAHMHSGAPSPTGTPVRPASGPARGRQPAPPPAARC